MKSTVYWFTGLSGAGKTTIGRKFYDLLKEKYSNTVFLDGDILREVFGDDLGHTLEDRKKSAMRNARLCKMLSEQNINVVCATISMFQNVRDWNRENILNYQEIYVKVSIDVLIQRDQKRLYSRALKGEISNVWGIDLPIEEPQNPDIVILNEGNLSPDEQINLHLNQFLK